MQDLSLPVRQPILSRLPQIQEAIRQTYRQYPYPWVIGYSGGKDSTTTLQLCWYALRPIVSI